MLLQTEEPPSVNRIREATPLALRDDALAKRSPRTGELAIAWAVFILLAYVPNLAPQRSVNLGTLTLFWSFFTMTLIILCDQITILLEESSLLQQATANGKRWVRLLTVGALSGLLLDGIAQWLGKLWIYPYWNQAVYGGTFVIGFCAYWLATAESYLAVRMILRRSLPGRQRAIKSQPHRTMLFRALGMFGLALIASGIALLWNGYKHAGGYFFDITTPVHFGTQFRYFLVAFAGIWLTLEWIQFACGRSSLLKTILNAEWQPLAALLIAGWIFGLFWETVNASHHFWIYTNWPLSQFKLMTVPATVLLTWPLQYVVFLSLGFVLGFDFWS